MKAHQLLDPLRRALRWHRRWFAAILAGVGVLAAISALAPVTSGTVPVVVAAHRVSAGATLSASDLAVVRFPPGCVAEGAFSDPGALVGREVVTTIPARGVLTVSDLSGTSLASPGKVALPVRFGDSATVAVLQAGSRIDILGQSADGAKVTNLVSDVRVLSVPARESGGGLGASTGELVLVEVNESDGATISAAAALSALSFVLH